MNEQDDKRDVEEAMTDEERKALHARMAEWFNG
jgi:hypothetical protein